MKLFVDKNCMKRFLAKLIIRKYLSVTVIPIVKVVFMLLIFDLLLTVL